MTLLADYTAGTISVSANGTAVTGTGTAWQTARFREGDWFIANGWVNVVASVNSNTSLTLAQPWRGGALSGAEYRLRYMSDGSRASAQARQLIDLLGGSGNLEALAGLVGEAGKVPVFTGAGTMGLAVAGDIAGPQQGVVDGEVAVFDGPSGRAIKSSGAAPVGYDEGTFTPTATFSSPGDLSVSYQKQTGVYTRIGNRVWCDIILRWTPSFTTATGQTLIEGLPFDLPGSLYGTEGGNGLFAPVAGHNIKLPAGAQAIWARANPESSTLTLVAVRDNQSFATVTANDFQTGRDARIHLSLGFSVDE